jgi:hypothetical protein
MAFTAQAYPQPRAASRSFDLDHDRAAALTAYSRTVADWLVKYDGPCARCGTSLARGTSAVWDRATRTMHCIACPEIMSGPELDRGVGGRSARAEYKRRAGKRDADITERWGTGLAAKVVRAVTIEPQSTRAWAIGAAGEEKGSGARDRARAPGPQ